MSLKLCSRRGIWCRLRPLSSCGLRRRASSSRRRSRTVSGTERMTNTEYIFRSCYALALNHSQADGIKADQYCRVFLLFIVLAMCCRFWRPQQCQQDSHQHFLVFLSFSRGFQVPLVAHSAATSPAKENGSGGFKDVFVALAMSETDVRTASYAKTLKKWALGRGCQR